MLLTTPGTRHPAPTFAASGGTTAAEFLRIPSGWPAGMSDAGGSVVRDGTALHWNPAGLSALFRRDAYVSHASYPETLSSDFLSLAFPMGGGPTGSVLGYSLQMLRQDAIDKLDNAGNAQGTFTALDMAHTLGYAFRRGRDRLGLSARFISQAIDGESGTALAAGLGWQRDFDTISAGAGVTNLGTKLKLRTEEYALPLTIRAGATWTILRGDLLLASDISNTKGLGTRVHLGTAYRIYQFREVPAAPPRGGIALRTGYGAGSREADGPSGLGAGTGIYYDTFRADVTYTPFGRFGNAVTIGLGYGF